MTAPPLFLKRGEDRRLRTGHPWVFSNEVDIARSPLTSFEPGVPVTVVAANGQPLGAGYVNPGTLICARLLSRDPRACLDAALIERRVRAALALRERMFDRPEYRLVYAEGDALPGLTVDRYGPHLVVQITTAGMERLRDAIVSALESVLAPESILLRNDVSIRALEGLPEYIEAAYGNAPDMFVIQEGGVEFEVPLLAGQKTGWFFDQRCNRLAIGPEHVRGRRVLDVFSYVGAWGLRAARMGAASVACIDRSAGAIARLRANALRNGHDAVVETIQDDALAALHALREQGRTFDVVILDPPAFIKRRKDVKSGLMGYLGLHRAALKLIGAQGLLVTASCSSHLTRDDFRNLLRQSAQQEHVNLRIIHQGTLPPDHPLHPVIPEADYLKCLHCHVSRTD
ncbi:MAG: class I SAM-dependent rRNA methyltransferase [Gammaproteobacteria bacterium]